MGMGASLPSLTSILAISWEGGRYVGVPGAGGGSGSNLRSAERTGGVVLMKRMVPEMVPTAIQRHGSAIRLPVVPEAVPNRDPHRHNKGESRV